MSGASDKQLKADLVADLLLQAPPCEFAQVYSDIHPLIDGDSEVKAKLPSIFAQYNTSQFVPVTLPGTNQTTLLTPHGDLGDGRFLCPRTKQSFQVDHIKCQVSAAGIQPARSKPEPDVETWRTLVDGAIGSYIGEHYRAGASTVYGRRGSDGGICLIACIESHYAKNETTGRWRSEWTVNLAGKPIGKLASISGTSKVQTHYFEEGNVQLISSKSWNFDFKVESQEQFVRDLIGEIRKVEDGYQMEIGQSLSLDIFSGNQTKKSKVAEFVRRRLPKVGVKMDWEKYMFFNIGKELNRQL